MKNMELINNFGWICLLLVLVLNPVSQAWPDGGYVSKTESVAVSADQRAILSKFGDYISMTFSTGYTGEGEDFGWILPTPVPPVLGDITETGKEGEDFFQFLDLRIFSIETD